MKKNRILHLCAALWLPLISYPNTAFSGTSHLWLPISYQAYHNRLLEAAKKVSQLEDCRKLLSGTLAEKLSSGNKIVFTFRCRDQDRKVFIVHVNNNNSQITYMKDIWRKKSMEEADAREQEKLRNKLAKRKEYWAVCEKAFMSEMGSFKEPKIVTPLPIKPEISENAVFTYLIEFQTISLKKRRLSYIASAVIDTLDRCDIKIRPI